MRDRKYRKTLGSLGLLWILLRPAVGQASNDRFLISPEQVAEAIVAAGVPVTAAQVRFLSEVSALGQDSDVRVMNMAKWLGNTWKVELRCQDHRACLPFYVLVDTGKSAAFEAISALARRGTTARLVLFGVPRPQIIMRNGDRATLLFENPTVRITMPVICLENGNLGQTIRVESTDHKQFFKAEIVKSGLLKVSL
jgi:Chaperone for flagella basal body P-ring formation